MNFRSALRTAQQRARRFPLSVICRSDVSHRSRDSNGGRAKFGIRISNLLLERDRQREKERERERERLGTDKRGSGANFRVRRSLGLYSPDAYLTTAVNVI